MYSSSTLLGWPRFMGIACLDSPKQLVGLLVHADDGAIRIIGLLINIQNIFHAGNKGGIVSRRDDPALLQMRFELVFFRICPTDT